MRFVSPLKLVAGFALAALIAGNSQAGVVIEGFESGNLAAYTSTGSDTFFVSGADAHDGSFGLSASDSGDPGWIYRDDAGVQLQQGDSFSSWVRLNSSSLQGGRAYFGFGASAAGTLSLVLAPNSGNLLFQNNAGYHFHNIGTSIQNYTLDKWYLAEVDWAVGGALTGKLFDSDGTTLLNTVTANDNTITSGGIAFRSFPDSSFDTITKINAASAVPEPGTISLAFIAVGSALFAARRRLRSTQGVA